MNLRTKLLLTTACACMSAMAAAQDIAPEAGLISASVPLANFMPREETVALNGAADEYRLSIPYTSRIRIRDAVLDLRWTNSISLLEGRSQIKVSLNGEALGQAPLKPSEPEGRLQVNLPAEQFREGYNDLLFKVSQHYATECEDPTAPELWTEIDPVESKLRIDYELAQVRPSLAEIEHLVSPMGTVGGYPLTVLYRQGDEVGGRLTEIGARVAAGMALRLKYVPMAVNAASLALARTPDGIPPGTIWLDESLDTDVVIIGTRKSISGAVPEDVIAEITSAYLGILPVSNQPGRFALLVSGVTAEDVSRAAAAFSLADLRLPDRRSTLVGDVAFPELPAYAHSNALQAQRQYRFGALGMKTTTLGSGSPDRVSFEAWVPPDLFVPVDANLEMHLHMAYGAGGSASSSLALFINDDFVSAIRLASPEGGVFRDYTLLLPATWLQPGSNRIEFRSFVKPEGQGNTCFAPSDRGLMVTLFDDSWLALSAARHHVSLPSLSLTARTGFPYSSPADGAALHIALTQNNDAVRAAAWTLFAKLVQQAGAPLQAASFGPAEAAGDRHALVVGALGSVPRRLLEAAPVRPGLNTKLVAEVLSMPEGKRLNPTLTTWLPPGRMVSDDVQSLSMPAVVDLSAALDDTSWLLQFESPDTASRVVTLATAPTSSGLLEGIHDLVRHERWGSLAGSVAAWRTDDRLVASAVGQRFTLGDVDLQTRASLFFTERPMLWIMVIAGSVLGFVLVSVLLLRIRTRLQG